jgi:hypothetical protein
MLVLNREGRFHTESAPMESCRPAIIVSFGVTARCGHHSPKRKRGGRLVAAKQESIPWQSFVFDAAWSSTIRNTSLGPLAKGGWAMTIFNFRQLRHSRSVSNPPQHSPKFAPVKLALNVIFAHWRRLIACVPRRSELSKAGYYLFPLQTPPGLAVGIRGWAPAGERKVA